MRKNKIKLPILNCMVHSDNLLGFLIGFQAIVSIVTILVTELILWYTAGIDGVKSSAVLLWWLGGEILLYIIAAVWCKIVTD